MATFANKVRQGPQNVVTHNPDNTRPSDFGRASDDTDPALIDAINFQGNSAKIHPTKAEDGELLPDGYSRSYVGFLFRTTCREIEVNQSVVKKEIDYLQRHVVLASFVGGRPSSAILSYWIEHLKRHIGGWVAIGRNLGRGFFQLRLRDPGMLQKLLMLTPYRTRWGTCIMQNWVPNFDPSNSRGMLVPTWITLRRVPDEFQRVARQIAQGIGEVLGGDRHNSTLEDQRFCLALPAGDGWEPSVTVTNSISGSSSTIIIDYTNLPIRCRF